MKAQRMRLNARMYDRLSLSNINLDLLVHQQVNQHRNRAGLRPLAWDKALHRIAAGHSADMARSGTFSHRDSQGRDFVRRYQDAGYRPQGIVDGSTGGENILQITFPHSAGSFDPSGKNPPGLIMDEVAAIAVREWLKSPGHRRNLMFPGWRVEGIGCVVFRGRLLLITQKFA